MPVDPIPEGYPRLSPYLVVPGVADLIDFLVAAFDGALIMRHDTPGGDVMHAEVRIGDSVIMMGEAGDAWRPMPAALHLYVEDVDATYRRALEVGATSLSAPEDQFYGNRSASIQDCGGNTWFLAARIEEISEEELGRRSEAKLAKRGTAEP